jgi:ribosomal-protein-alanine N-acetyltransferase
MRHKGTKKLETERLLLRPFAMEDAEGMYRNWANDPEVTKYLTWPTHECMEVSRLIIEDWISHYDELDYYQWAIVFKDGEDEPIGSIGVVNKDDQIEMVHIGYCIGQKWWKQGIMSEALSALINFFFEEVEVNRIESRFDPNNLNSGKVMKKCGMKYEGTFREADWNNQGRSDAVMYAILARDYEAL